MLLIGVQCRPSGDWNGNNPLAPEDRTIALSVRLGRGFGIFIFEDGRVACVDAQHSQFTTGKDNVILFRTCKFVQAQAWFLPVDAIIAAP